jgi:nitroimidazol reductase NimA-like FMN-containing flavoprotein (pyridoxamine 5'-phosphate oxidase superfamily)
MHDEPVLGRTFEKTREPVLPEKQVQDSIRELVQSEPFAVLCTQGQAQPYGSLVAFAFDTRLGNFVFATPMATRKFRLLSECERVALVVDNRGQFPDDMMRVEAITVTGRAVQVESGGPAFERWAALLLTRHPYLQSFIEAPSTALFRVEVVRVLHVTRFQEVRQWLPASDG